MSENESVPAWIADLDAFEKAAKHWGYIEDQGCGGPEDQEAYDNFYVAKVNLTRSIESASRPTPAVSATGAEWKDAIIAELIQIYEWQHDEDHSARNAYEGLAQRAKALSPPTEGK